MVVVVDFVGLEPEPGGARFAFVDARDPAAGDSESPIATKSPSRWSDRRNARSRLNVGCNARVIGRDRGEPKVASKVRRPSRERRHDAVPNDLASSHTRSKQ